MAVFRKGGNWSRCAESRTRIICGSLCHESRKDSQTESEETSYRGKNLAVCRSRDRQVKIILSYPCFLENKVVFSLFLTAFRIFSFLLKFPNFANSSWFRGVGSEILLRLLGLTPRVQPQPFFGVQESRLLLPRKFRAVIHFLMATYCVV